MCGKSGPRGRRGWRAPPRRAMIFGLSAFGGQSDARKGWGAGEADGGPECRARRRRKCGRADGPVFARHRRIDSDACRIAGGGIGSRVNVACASLARESGHGMLASGDLSQCPSAAGTQWRQLEVTVARPAGDSSQWRHRSVRGGLGRCNTLAGERHGLGLALSTEVPQESCSLVTCWCAGLLEEMTLTQKKRFRAQVQSRRVNSTRGSAEARNHCKS